MEAKYPGQFRAELAMDSGVSGRLEVTIFFNETKAQKTGGVLVHSKANGQGYPYQDWPSFEKRLKEAVDAQKK